jgi:hypothetical protein
MLYSLLLFVYLPALVVPVLLMIVPLRSGRLRVLRSSAILIGVIVALVFLPGNRWIWAAAFLPGSILAARELIILSQRRSGESGR